MASEIDCITSCIIQPFDPVNFYANIVLGVVLAAAILLLIFGNLSIKRMLLAKSIMLLSIFGLLLNWWFISPSFETVFSTLHNSILLIILLFFLISYFFSSQILRMGLHITIPSKEIISCFEQSKKEANQPTVSLKVFKDSQKIAFAVAGLQPTVFVSTSVFESFSPREWDAIFQHELLHFSGSFLSLKRILHSIHAGFFGLLPISLDDFDAYEEEKLDELLERKGTRIRLVRQKMS